MRTHLLPAALALAACASARDANEAPAADAGPVPIAVPPLAPSACQDGDEHHQRWSTDCLCCHTAEFGVAGSVDPLGAPVARVLVVDAKGAVADMAPNPYSNFFRHLQLEAPLRVTVFSPDGRALTMPALAPSGACNRCHRVEGGTARMVHGPP
jgi:hypothetical protein